MQFLPGPNANQAVIRPDTFEAPIEVTGLSAEVLAGLFHGAADARAHWTPGLELTAGLVQSPAAAEAASAESGRAAEAAGFEQDLEDGRAILRSGHPGTVVVEAGHRLSEELLQPQSLYLLLAQQWARAGLMLVHGAAFEFEGQGILALGDRGAGKSVLTMAALAAGARVVSDDWLMVGLDADGVVRAERLREFLMLRHGLACDRLLSVLPDLNAAALHTRPKSVMHLEVQPANLHSRLCRTCRIHLLWLLQRPRAGRTGSSIRSQAQSAAALSALIRATMPILFSRRFDQEAGRLRATAGRLATGSRAIVVRTGTDILDNPARALRSMV